MAKTFEQLAIENLAGFGWTIDESQMADYRTCRSTLDALSEWWNGLEDKTRRIVGGCDLADGLWEQGMLTGWPGLYALAKGNRFEYFGSTMNDVLACIERANQAVGEQQADAAADTEHGTA